MNFKLRTHLIQKPSQICLPFYQIKFSSGFDYEFTVLRFEDPDNSFQDRLYLEKILIRIHMQMSTIPK